MISPLLSNIYLHVLDRVWEDRCAPLGTLVRYADDFVVMCDTKAAVEEAQRRVSAVLTRLGLELHSEKTRTVDLSRGGWGQYFRTGNAAVKFIQIDRYVEDRLRGLLLKRAGSRLRPGRAAGWYRPFFEALGLYRLRGTIQYPGVAHATT